VFCYPLEVTGIATNATSGVFRTRLATVVAVVLPGLLPIPQSSSRPFITNYYRAIMEQPQESTDMQEFFIESAAAAGAVVPPAKKRLRPTLPPARRQLPPILLVKVAPDREAKVHATVFALPTEYVYDNLWSLLGLAQNPWEQEEGREHGDATSTTGIDSSSRPPTVVQNNDDDGSDNPADSDTVFMVESNILDHMGITSEMCAGYVAFRRMATPSDRCKEFLIALAAPNHLLYEHNFLLLTRNTLQNKLWNCFWDAKQVPEGSWGLNAFRRSVRIKCLRDLHFRDELQSCGFNDGSYRPILVEKLQQYLRTVDVPFAISHHYAGVTLLGATEELGDDELIFI
jgi:hypothetical protein